MTDLAARLAVVAVLAVVVLAVNVWYRRRRAADADRGATDASTGRPLWPPLPAELRSDRPATWVVFTTPLCASCGAVQSDLELAFPHHAVVKIDATEQPELADAYAVRRAPTTIVADTTGVVVERLVGPEAVRDFIGAVDDPAALLR